MKRKDIKQTIKEYFFVKPNAKLRVRGIERTLKLPLPSVIRYCKELEKEGILALVKMGNVNFYTANRGSEKYLLKKKLFNIHEVVERVRALVKVQNKNINIHRDYDPSIPEIVADPEQLIQVLLNLACNSAEALEGQGDIVLRTRAMRQFTISKTRHKLVVAIEIIDNGPGVPEDIKDKIFFPMITGRVEGTGLGLSIAQSIVNHHGGLIDCISEPGHTVFQIFLPLEECGAE